ncbi:hypothetical protein PoB_007437300 [Plakobranchus ocellatus]|uniref:Uncharacterized protein n=1 Tax=Plakobranchus ocellatus TaxID=259542 RepID=A0AAV4DU93_9GAST|nr:hypothetical protein PoB_007437300 [Plakobranchus ocellatus]
MYGQKRCVFQLGLWVLVIAMKIFASCVTELPVVAVSLNTVAYLVRQFATNSSKEKEKSENRVLQSELRDDTVESESALRSQGPSCRGFELYNQHPGLTEGLKV